MAKTYIILFFLATSKIIFSQGLMSELALSSTFFSNMYFQHDTLIDEETFDSLMVSNNKVADLYWKASAQNTIKTSACALGTFFIAFPSIIYIIESTNLAEGENNPLNKDKLFWTMLGSGVALVGGSIPLHIASKRNMQEAINLYNSGLTSFTKTDNLKFSISSNNISLRLVF